MIMLQYGKVAFKSQIHRIDEENTITQFVAIRSVVSCWMSGKGECHNTIDIEYEWYTIEYKYTPNVYRNTITTLHIMESMASLWSRTAFNTSLYVHITYIDDVSLHGHTVRVFRQYAYIINCYNKINASRMGSVRWIWWYKTETT